MKKDASTTVGERITLEQARSMKKPGTQIIWRPEVTLVEEEQYAILFR